MIRKKPIDTIDKEILGFMLNSGCKGSRWLSTNELSDSLTLNWKTVYRHLTHLKTEHYVKSRRSGKARKFKRKFGKNKQDINVTSERKIEWTLNVKK